MTQYRNPAQSAAARAVRAYPEGTLVCWNAPRSGWQRLLPARTVRGTVWNVVVLESRTVIYGVRSHTGQMHTVWVDAHGAASVGLGHGSQPMQGFRAV